VSGKRAKPKGPSDLSAELTPDEPTSSTAGTATDLLERPELVPQASPVLPGNSRGGARNAARVERRRKERRQRLIAAGTAAALLFGLVAWFLVSRSGGGADAAAPPAGRTQSTVLLEVRLGSSAGLALLAADPATGEGAVVLLPNRLMVEVAGFGSMTLGAAVGLPAKDAAADALADSLGITVDGTWQLDEKGFAALVDVAGGATVDVDTDITGPGATKGSEVVLIPAGNQHLDGASAAVYAGFHGAGEPEQSRLARLDSVLAAVLRGLPTDSGQVTLTLGALGAGSSSTMPEQLPAFLSTLRGAEVGTAVVHRTLPVRSIDAGGSTPAVGLDPDASAALVDDLLASSHAAQRPGGDVRVLVQNGVGTPGLGSTARDLLVAEGFTYVAGGNASSFGNAHSVVLITDATAESRAEGVAIVKALGLPASALRVTAQGQSIADVVVVLGKDYKP
jgi:LytR cell envelope-related transcriptional attenuator/LytR_cpsA_psr family